MWKCEIPLRDYQKDCLDSLSKDQKDHDRLLVSIPTGGGKTIIFTTFSLNTGYRTLVIAHRDELLEQAVAKYRMVGGNVLDTGFIRSGEWREARFTVASIQTLYRNLSRIDGRKWDLVVVDECHHLPAPTYRAVIDRIVETNPDVKVLGFTATPFRADKQDLKEFFDKVSFSIDILELMARGYLVPLKGYLVPLPVDMSELKTVRTANGEADYSRSSIAKAFNTPEVNKAIVEKWKELASDRKTIFYTARRDHAKALWAEFEKAGISSAYVDGEMSLTERRNILEAFKRGDVQVLTNVDVLTEGFDDPEVDCIGLVRPTKSLNLYAQIVGRGLRIAPDKKNCLLLDFTGVSRKHTVVGLPELFGIEEIREHWEKGEAVSVGAGSGKERDRSISVLIGNGKEELVFDAYEVQKYAVRVPDGWVVVVGKESFLWLYPAGNETYSIDEVNTATKERKNLKKNLTEDYAWSVLTTLWKFKKEDWIKEYEVRAVEQRPTFKQRKILVSAVNSGFLSPESVGELTRQKASALISYLTYRKGHKVLFSASPKTFEVVRVGENKFALGYSDRFFPFSLSPLAVTIFTRTLLDFGFAVIDSSTRGFFDLNSIREEVRREIENDDNVYDNILDIFSPFWSFLEYPVQVLDLPVTRLGYFEKVTEILQDVLFANKNGSRDNFDDDLFDF